METWVEGVFNGFMMLLAKDLLIFLCALWEILPAPSHIPSGKGGDNAEWVSQSKQPCCGAETELQSISSSFI